MVGFVCLFVEAGLIDIGMSMGLSGNREPAWVEKGFNGYEFTILYRSWV